MVKASHSKSLYLNDSSEIMNKKKNKSQDSLSFLGLGHQDYLAARLLLINGLLPQGSVLAATAVEKHLKCIASIKGNRCKGHLEMNLTNLIENQFPTLYKDLNIDFIKFLRKSYKLRYHDDKTDRFSIVINQYRTLAELDIIINLINSGIKIEDKSGRSKSPYNRDLEEKNNLLYNENYILLEVNRETFFDRSNRVFETSIEPEGRGLSIEYTTPKVMDEGSFLKPVDMSSSKETWKVTSG